MRKLTTAVLLLLGTDWCLLPAPAADGVAPKAPVASAVQPTNAPPTRIVDYATWRAQYPARDLTPRPTDGRNLALSIRKLEKGFDPPRPFVIWVVGSSWAGLQQIDTLRHIIRQRFPNAPEIVCKTTLDSVSERPAPYQYLRGWVNQSLATEQPDLILLYPFGERNDVYLDWESVMVRAHGENYDWEELLRDIRSQSTADVIAGSRHVVQNEGPFIDEVIDLPYWTKKGEIARKYNCEWVDNRRECAEYMRQQKLPLFEKDQPGFLANQVRPTEHGQLIINENFARHFAPAQPASPAPDELERRLNAVGGRSIRRHEAIVAGRSWTVTGDTLVCVRGNSPLKVKFQGNRIDLIGVARDQSGSVRIRIDGQPAEYVAAFRTTAVKGAVYNSNGRYPRDANDHGPHWVQLGRHVVPQTWTITIADKLGHYDVRGSVTGPDGTGHVLQPFTSTSGQIIIDSYYWRGTAAGGQQGGFLNKPGESWTFEVVRATISEVSFAANPGTKFRTTLAQNLANGEHTLEVIPDGKGPVAVCGFDIFEPRLKPESIR